MTKLGQRVCHVFIRSRTTVEADATPEAGVSAEPQFSARGRARGKPKRKPTVKPAPKAERGTYERLSQGQTRLAETTMQT